MKTIDNIEYTRNLSRLLTLMQVLCAFIRTVLLIDSPEITANALHISGAYRY
jgi:hypothetical protein